MRGCNAKHTFSIFMHFDFYIKSYDKFDETLYGIIIFSQNALFPIEK